MSVDAEVREVTGRTGDRADRVVFAEHGAAQVVVSRSGGTAPLWVTTDGTSPSTSRSPWRWCLHPGEPSLTVPVPVDAVAEVRLHAGGAVVEYQVLAL